MVSPVCDRRSLFRLIKRDWKKWSTFFFKLVPPTLSIFLSSIVDYTSISFPAGEAIYKDREENNRFLDYIINKWLFIRLSIAESE